MSYDRETKGSAERKLDYDRADAKLFDYVRDELIAVTKEYKTEEGEPCWERWSREAPETITSMIRERMDAVQRMCDSRRYNSQRVHGVETRDERTHNRHTKLRIGSRIDKYGESRTDWYVLDMPKGWLGAIRGLAFRRAACRGDSAGGQDYREELDREVSAAVLARTGHDCEPYNNTTGYDCSGRWFASLHYRQVGRRLLVTLNHSLDI